MTKKMINKINSRKKDELFVLGVIMISFIISYLTIIENGVNLTKYYNSNVASYMINLKDSSNKLFRDLFFSERLLLIFTAIMVIGVLFIIIRTRKIPKGLIILFIGYLILYFKDIKKYPDVYVENRVFINNWTTYIIPCIFIYFTYKIIRYNNDLNKIKSLSETPIKYIDYKGILIYTLISLVSIYILKSPNGFFNFNYIFKSTFKIIGSIFDLTSGKTISRFGSNYGNIEGNYIVYVMTIYLFWVSSISNIYTIYRSIKPKKVPNQMSYESYNNLKYEIKNNYNEIYEDLFSYDEYEDKNRFHNTWRKKPIGEDIQGRKVYEDCGRYITVNSMGYIEEESCIDSVTYKYDDNDYINNYNDYINYDDSDNGCYNMYSDNNNFYDDYY